MNIKDLLLSYFNSDNYVPLRMKEVADRFGLKGVERAEFYDIIDGLLSSGQIKMSKRGKIRPSSGLGEFSEDSESEKTTESSKTEVAPSKKDKTKKPKRKRRRDSISDFDVAYTAPVDQWADKETSKEVDALVEEGKAIEAEEFLEEIIDQNEETSKESLAESTDAETRDDDFQDVETDQTQVSFDEEVTEPKDERVLKDNEGILKGNQKGFGFFVSSNPDLSDTFISPDGMNGALHGDTVRVKLTRKADPDRGFKQEGVVTHVLERNTDTIVGTYEKRNGFGFVLPDDKKYFKDIYIDEANENGAKNNDKVVVAIDKYEKEYSNPEGHIVEVLGNVNATGVDITAIARRFDLPYQFSKATLQEVEQLPTEVTAKDRRDRKDLRRKFTVTIDGADAKDFDDAISVEKRGKFYNLYVHIADVTHYLRPGSALDKDAFERGNSVYLLDRVIPMLPEELSNGLCSLLPGEDRLTMTTQLTMNNDGKIVDFQFYPSVINSDHRLVYDKVSDYLENGTRFDDNEQLYKELDTMYEIYEILAEKREQRGTIDFEFPETEIVLNAEGEPTYVGREVRRVANKIIEEFMILNNQTVGSYFNDKQLPYIYRVHDEPNEDRVERLNRALYAFQYDPVSPQPQPDELRQILEKAKGKKEEDILNMLVLQSMSKAHYSPRPGMHFGLAIDHYSHFTAPIRRYSDVIAHRLLKRLLAGKPIRKGDDEIKNLEYQCQHISDTEVKAEDAERDAVDMKTAEYMQKHVGETFPGIVSSLTNFGIFIMLENTVEGLVHFRDMTDDYYTYVEDRFVVLGERTKRQIRYGDKVEVLLVRSNPELREIDFHLVRDEEDNRYTSDGSNNKDQRRRRNTSPRNASPKPKNWTGGKIATTNEARKKGESGHRNRLSNKSFRKKKRDSR